MIQKQDKLVWRNAFYRDGSLCPIVVPSRRVRHSSAYKSKLCQQTRHPLDWHGILAWNRRKSREQYRALIHTVHLTIGRTLAMPHERHLPRQSLKSWGWSMHCAWLIIGFLAWYHDVPRPNDEDRRARRGVAWNSHWLRLAKISGPL